MTFNNSYINLPENFYEKVSPEKVPEASLIKFNSRLADDLNLDLEDIGEDELAEYFSGNKIFEGSEPIALAYAGHQFGHFVPQLGDGRAILLGEVLSSKFGRRDIQLKGSGQTRFSRAGDGKAALGPVLREYLVSEAMHALGVPTTRSLAAVTTGEDVYRETILPGAIVTRVASSHIRVGTFEYFAAREDVESLELLVDYVINRHYPEIKDLSNKYLALIEAVGEKQAELVSSWMSVGFVHGVMNTDNMSIAGETIDYGPCAFMESYDPATVFSSIDHYGRYAYANQGFIAQWNLSCLANTLLGFIDGDREAAIEQVQELLVKFKESFSAKLRFKLLAKIGILDEKEGDRELLQEFLELLQEDKVDFTLAFRTLASALDKDSEANKFKDLFGKLASGVDEWLSKWQARLEASDRDFKAIKDSMNSVNPVYIPRNHKVEEALAAAQSEDFSLFERMNEILSNPFEEQEGAEAYALPYEDKSFQYRTFCGT
ncbi:MAG: YdiU family protein [Candidatus Caenarcaniphilales bacterium]|nr:YdiU family protein [Candidatus Caenarcaniphilales bacterium]